MEKTKVEKGKDIHSGDSSLGRLVSGASLRK